MSTLQRTEDVAELIEGSGSGTGFLWRVGLHTPHGSPDHGRKAVPATQTSGFTAEFTAPDQAGVA
jgi:hypothetical protein